MRIIKFILMLISVLILVLIGLAFVTHNQALVTVNLLLVPPVETKVAVWLISFFALGGIIGMLVSLPLLLKEKVKIRKLERRMQNTSKIISGYTV